MASGQQIGRSQALPTQRLHIQHLVQLLHAEGQEGLEDDRQVGRDLQGDVHNRSHTVHIRLRQLPRLGVG